MESWLSTRKAAERIDLSVTTVKARAKKRQITPVHVGSRNGYYFSKEQVDLISKDENDHRSYDAEYWEAVRLFHTLKDNQTCVIAEMMGLTYTKVSNIISRHHFSNAQTDGMILPSKMNYDKNDI